MNLKAIKEAKELIEKIKEDLHPVCCTSQDYARDMDDTAIKIAILTVNERIKELQTAFDEISVHYVGLSKFNIYIVARLNHLFIVKKELKKMLV